MLSLTERLQRGSALASGEGIRPMCFIDRSSSSNSGRTLVKMTHAQGLLRLRSGLVARLELLSLLGGNQAKPHRAQDGLGAALHAKLHQDMPDMGFDGVLDN